MQLLKKAVIAIALAFPAVAMAQSAQDLKNELDAMKAKIKQLEAMVEAINVKAATVATTDAENQAEFNRMRIKTEAMDDQLETSGLKGFKISGFIDPTYIYNQRQNTSSFILMKNFSDVNGTGAHPSQNAAYAYDNAFFGSALLRFEKEMEGGTKWLLELMPHKSYGDGGGYNLGSMVNQAFVSIPVNGLNNRFLAGQIGSWPGYEYQLTAGALSKKNITNSLLFDFTEPSFMTGFGYEHLEGKWDIKTIIGGANNGRVTDRKSPNFHWRVDYSKGEFAGWGASGLHGKMSSTTSVNYVEADTYFIRGDLTLQGQLETGITKSAAFNGNDAKWVGVSGLAAYKFMPRLEGIARFDYIKNAVNGGGVPSVVFPGGCSTPDLATDPSGATAMDSTCGDYRNGFGPGIDNATGMIMDPNKGANRYAMTFGLNYALAPNVLMKFEVRRDGSSQNTFYDVTTNTYKKDNLLVGASAVVSF
ncbi:MAG: DUF3138 family protein [Pseudomonadota bacterium]